MYEGEIEKIISVYDGEIEKISSVYEKSRLGDFYRKKIPIFPKTTPGTIFWKPFLYCKNMTGNKCGTFIR